MLNHNYNVSAAKDTRFVCVRGAREHNLKNVNLIIPRDTLVVFTGVSGSGKTSLAFGTLYAEAERRYLESVSPYARRLFHQMPVPKVDEIEGLPPAVALQQQRGLPTTRSTVGSVTTLSNLLRMLYSRTGDYPPHVKFMDSEYFSPNTPMGACPVCHGLGRIYDVTERSMVPDDSLTIRERAVAAWPTAWQGQNLRDILVSLGHDVDKPWRELPKAERDWILFTDEQPVVPVYAGFTPEEVREAHRRRMEPSYQGTFTSAKRHVMHTFANTESASMKKRVARYMISRICPECHGKRLRKEALAVKFDGRDIAEMARLPLKQLAVVMERYATGRAFKKKEIESHPERVAVAQRIAQNLYARLSLLLDLGLGYLLMERSSPTLSPGELQRLRLATQIYSNLFGVVYVLDEPSAGLHPADIAALLRALDKLKAAGNSLFIVEHDLDVIRHAEWVVDIGPGPGEQGGQVLYNGELPGLAKVSASSTRRYLFCEERIPYREPRKPHGWFILEGITRNNLNQLDVAFPLGVFVTVTGVSGSGKSSLVSQAVVDLLSARLGYEAPAPEEGEELRQPEPVNESGKITAGMENIKRLVVVDQKPIGRTPRSNLATYTGLFDHVRQLFAATKMAKARRYDAGRFSFNVPKGRCATCQGEGWVMIELLFLPSVYAPCPTCHGARYNAKTLEIVYRDKNIADVLAMTVDEAKAFFQEEPPLQRSLDVLREVGVGYLRLGQPAPELSGGEAQRIKLATELQRAGKGYTLYILDEPTTGLHPADVDKLMIQLNSLVDAGNTVIVVEQDMRMVSSSDWVIDIGPGAGDEGGKIVAAGPPSKVATIKESKTAPYLAAFIGN